MAVILGIDVGTKTLGLAVSDEGATIAFPLRTLQRVGLRRDLGALAELIAEREIAEVVVGWPLNLDGTEGELAAAAQEIADGLVRRCRLAVHRWDERLTTVAAERALLATDVSRRRRKGLVDNVAAALILQGFLDRRSHDRESGP